MDENFDELFIGSQVRIEDEDGTLMGTIVGIKDGLAEVREWTLQDEEWIETDSIYDILVSSIKSEVFFIETEEDKNLLLTAPSCGNEKNLYNILTSELKDGEMTEQDFEILVKSIAKLVIAEIGVNITTEEKADTTPSAEMSEADAIQDTKEMATASPLLDVVDSTSLSANTESVEPDEAIEEVKEVEEVEAKEADASCCAEDCAHEECECCKDKVDAPAEAAAVDAPAEEAVADEAPAEGEKADFLTLKDLKEFSDLVKML